MSAIGLIFSSSTGNTEDAANAIQAEFDKLAEGLITVHHVTDASLEELTSYDNLILGVPTWNIGDPEMDWDDAMVQFDALDLSGKQVAVFGLGDQFGYPDSYQDAIGVLAMKARERGAELVGYTDTDGHEFDESLAVEDGRFMGLALDVDNQEELSAERIARWVAQLVQEFKLNIASSA